jgi:hypothetical protein
MTPTAPSLDTSGGTWVGSFPRLGRVRVRADGSYDVEVDAAQADRQAAHDALEWGWAEPLALARQGFLLAAATAVTPPDGDRGGALLIGGPSASATSLAILLCEAGWQLLADTVTPLRMEPAVTAHPRRAPWLAPRRPGITSPLLGDRPLRPGTTAVRVQAEANRTAEQVRARLTVRRDPVAVDDVLAPARGQDRMAALHAVVGAHQPGRMVSAPEQLRTDLALAGLPLAAVHWPDDATPGSRAATVDRVRAWWAEVVR